MKDDRGKVRIKDRKVQIKKEGYAYRNEDQPVNLYTIEGQ